MGKIKDLMKKSRFWKIYIYTIGVFLCLLVVGLIVFSLWLSDYESSQNTVEVDKIMSMFENRQYLDLIRKTDVVTAGLVDESVYEEKLRAAAEGKTISYVKAFSYDRFASPSYIVKADDQKLCKITLKKAAKTSKFGFSLYEFDYLSEFSFADINVILLSPKGSIPHLNGQPVNDIFKKKLAKDQPAKSNYTLSSEPLTIYRYEICGLLKEPESVTVKGSDGSDCVLTHNANHEIVAAPLDVTINAPSGFKITVNGVALTERYATEQSKPNESVQYLLNESDKNKLSLFHTYRVEQLSRKPEVTVKDQQGNDIACTYNAETRTFDVGIKVFTFRIPSNYRVQVNGAELTSLEHLAVEKNLEIAELKNIPEQYFTRPSLNVYKVAVISGDLTVAAKDSNGNSVTLAYDERSMTYRADFRPQESLRATYEQIAIDGAKQYAGFMSNDISMSTFLSRIVSGTQMYKDMSEYRQYWYTDHDSTSFENVEAYDLRVYGEQCFSCAVYFDYWIFGQRGKPDFKQKLETNTRIWYVKSGNSWYMADLEIFERGK